MATVLVPGEHTAVIDVTGSYQMRNSLSAWYQSVAGYYGAQYPHLDASARACAAHHAVYASRAVQESAGYETGVACPTLWPANPSASGFDVDDSVVGWQTYWMVPAVPFLVSTYQVAAAQVTRRLAPLTFADVVAASPSWIAAAESVLPIGQEWRAIDTAAVTSITATATFNVSAFTGTETVGMNVYRRTDGTTDWVSPGDSPGSLVGTLSASGAGPSIDVPWDEILTSYGWWAFVANNADTDLGAAPGATPGSGKEVTLARMSADVVTATFTGTVTSEGTSIFGVPPLHAAQRRGGTDAHAAHARGADTRQSRLLARGPL